MGKVVAAGAAAAAAAQIGGATTIAAAIAGTAAMSDLKYRSVELIGDRGKDEHYWIKRAGARAQLYAAGYVKEDFEKVGWRGLGC